MGLFDRITEKINQVVEKTKEYEIEVNGKKIQFNAKPSELETEYEKEIKLIGEDPEKLYKRAKELDAQDNSDSFWYFSKGRELGHPGCMYEWALALLPEGEYPLSDESKAALVKPIASLKRAAQLGHELAIQEMMARGLD